ncbi:hypothetical protein STP4a_096 [Salmonella phage STP4-a]|uniref:T4 y05I-like putative transcription factor C-terminal domain-containing protein n=1 Tax=Salmonella phage STP4-a TaxID=1445860 RepID=A0A0B4L9H3_9CAUD|nr:hypothetical protein STP4a_096 [Salmonella phage STP4-a]AHJ86951.1 hypothetical protein STP4a_096 [Salmonella phage STP4-a]UFK27221.1 hypothetical protein LG358_00200 [Escherichia phage UoN_LG358_1]
MTVMNFKGVGREANVIDASFGEISVLNLDVIEHGYQGQNYEIVSIIHRDYEDEDVEIFLLKTEAEKLRDYLNIVLPSMKGNEQ